MQEAVKGAVRPHPAHPVLAADQILHHVAALAAALQQLRRGRRRLRGDSAASAPYWAKCVGAGVVAWAMAAAAGSSALGMHQPADAPAGHRPGLGEAVDDEDRIVVVGDRAETTAHAPRRHRSACHRPRRLMMAMPRCAAEIQDGLLLVAAVSIQPVGLPGEADEHRLGARVAGVEQLVEIQMPAAGCSSPRPAAPAAARRRPPWRPGRCWARSARRSRHCRRSRTTICSARHHGQHGARRAR